LTEKNLLFFIVLLTGSTPQGVDQLKNVHRKYHPHSPKYHIILRVVFLWLKSSVTNHVNECQ
ncbi:hypothetical protein NE704_10520, partial [[Ruminococcus] gnavus]|uniref:hypothetical protein n=1 Tax=Mediterraneibacter gnavus TaxID=33038 RepID=UPI00210EE240